MDIIFDSRDTFYRNPFGAVREESGIHFKIVLPRYLNCSAATLKVAADNNSETFLLKMFWCGMHGDSHEIWECDFVPQEKGLYWYDFEIDTNCGKQILSKRTKSGQAQMGSGDRWQLTVFSKEFETPDWLNGGVMYQIFPDRFYSSQKNKTAVPSDRNISKKWGEMPDFLPNENGEVLNSDYFCGDLEGIEKKLDYLKELGVTCIYLNPIFEAHSNHRYNTADYSKIDPILGTQEDFERLCKKAHEKGIRIILDGVFSHTGSDSVYFNKNNRYESLGAYNSKESKYYDWYSFSKWPEHYDSWWGFETLPELNETNPKYNEFINGKEGIARKWLNEGASGWRLDVADELPDSFMENFRETVKSEKSDALIIGEVWEDASNKESYSHRRKFLLGKQLDSVMNYPFKNAILGFLKGEDARDKMEDILNILENYPRPVVRNLMNIIGTHDTERALTILCGEPIYDRGREWQSVQKLSKEQREYGIKLMKVAAAMQFTLPGVPCIYYGDEVGVEGYKDPFNRTCYPWGNEDKELLSWYKSLSELRKSVSSLTDGDFVPVYAEQDFISYIRKDSSSTLLCAFNQSDQEKLMKIPEELNGAKPLLGTVLKEGYIVVPQEGCAFIELTKVIERPQKEERVQEEIIKKTVKAKRESVKKETKATSKGKEEKKSSKRNTAKSKATADKKADKAIIKEPEKQVLADEKKSEVLTVLKNNNSEVIADKVLSKEESESKKTKVGRKKKKKTKQK